MRVMDGRSRRHHHAWRCTPRGLVSSTRARVEALGVECKVGIASRAVRVVILSAGLLFAAGELVPGFDLLEPAIYAMAALTIFTTFQRVLHVRKQLAVGAPPV